MKYILIISGSIVIIASFAALLRSPVWWIRGLDFPRLQLASVGCINLIIFVFIATKSFFDILFIVVLTSAIVLQLKYILPFSRFIKQQVQGADDGYHGASISIVIANVLTPNRRYHDLLSQIRDVDPDVVLTLESDMKWQQQLRVLEKDYPYVCRCPQDNLYGMHLYSKLKLIDPQIRYLIENDVPSIRGLIELHSGDRILFYGLHPAPPSPTENSHSTERDGELLMVGKEINETKEAVVVTGDLNDVAWSDTTLLFRKISGLLDPRLGRGMYNSFNAKHWFLRWPLDHVFHGPEFKLMDMRRLNYFGSDHFPIYIKLAYAPEKAEDHIAENGDTDDHAIADEKIDAAIEAGKT